MVNECDKCDVSKDEVHKIMTSTSNSFCHLDPIPSSLVKKSSTALLPILTKIINMSLQSATVPSMMKHSIVIPRLKKSCFPPKDLTSYRPISHLSFITKLTETVAAAQIKEHLNENELLPKVQSAYRQHHCVESALLKVQNDVLLALDHQKEAVLACLISAPHLIRWIMEFCWIDLLVATVSLTKFSCGYHHTSQEDLMK